MLETNIWLDKEDKQLLTKKAHSKQLSLSTFIGIVAKNYYIITNVPAFKGYIHKGKYQTHIKIRNKEQYKLTPTLITNALYLYLHHDKHPLYTQDAIKKILIKLDRKVQSNSDTEIDNFWLGNQIIRANYMNKGKKQC